MSLIGARLNAVPPSFSSVRLRVASLTGVLLDRGLRSPRFSRAAIKTGAHYSWACRRRRLIGTRIRSSAPTWQCCSWYSPLFIRFEALSALRMFSYMICYLCQFCDLFACSTMLLLIV